MFRYRFIDVRSRILPVGFCLKYNVRSGKTRREGLETRDLRDKTAIVGVGYTAKQGVVPNTTDTRLALEACKNAIEDAGLKKDDIDGLLLQPTMGGVHSYNIAATLGIDLRFTGNLDVMGASSGCIARRAARA